MIDPRTPILVGCGQITDTTSQPSSERSNVAFCAEAARLALADTGASIGADALGRKLDAVAVLEFFPDVSPRFASPFGRCTNPPRSVANRLNAAPRQQIYTHQGGNTPQYLVNRFAEEIANGDTEFALICGAELLRSTQNARKAGLAIDHNEDPGGEPTRVGDKRFGFSDEEARHDLRAAIHFYPLLENAIRAGLKRDVASHMTAMGRLFARLAAVARDNRLATRREGYSAERLATISDDNRWICFPYPRLMNANAIIDQAAAVLMTSVEKARECGIPEDRWVFLHGCADGVDTWVVSERQRLDASPAINGCARVALDMAGKTAADVAAFDLYSCFPIAVFNICDGLGLAPDDPRGLTVTGGLPFFGGAGNNYSMHAIASMTRALRARPGALGLVGANGGFLSKYSVGIYSTAPKAWAGFDSRALQAEVDAWPAPALDPAFAGEAAIETYTIDYSGPQPRATVIASSPAGARVVAMADDPDQVAEMIARDPRDGRITVAPDAEGREIVGAFTPGA